MTDSIVLNMRCKNSQRNIKILVTYLCLYYIYTYIYLTHQQNVERQCDETAMPFAFYI